MMQDDNSIIDFEGIIDDEDILLPLLEAKILLDDKMSFEDDSKVFEEIHAYTKRFNIAVNTKKEYIDLVPHLDAARQQLDAYWQFYEGEEAKIEKHEIVALINLLALNSEVGELKAVVPTMRKFKDEHLEEILLIVKKFRRSIT
tara:strand:- start:274 stop:705 length:432 start_codon:yes stop_codon:yes gene_type:complete